MSKPMITITKNTNLKVYQEEHGHQYKCRNIYTGELYICEKLPPILKMLRELTNYDFKVPHGNKVRTLILEEGTCIITDNDSTYEVTIEKW